MHIVNGRDLVVIPPRQRNVDTFDVRPVTVARAAPRRPLWDARLAETLLRGRIVDLLV